MELTREEMQKACNIAAQVVEQRVNQFKPDTPAIRNKKGWVCEQVFRGSVGDELVCSISLQWNYTVAGSVGRVVQSVHVQLRCIVKPDGRFLRVTGLHVPEWTMDHDACVRCGQQFVENVEIKADTSLQEY